MKSANRPSFPRRSRARGFTLIEVLVALMITCIGLLGIAKIQALAYASTESSSLRALVALQAAGLAASMHANRVYWGAGSAPSPLTITGLTIADATLSQPATCMAPTGPPPTPCTSAVLAAYDLQSYAQSLYAMMGSNPLTAPITTITCPTATPDSCTIQVTWYEHAVSLDRQSVAGTTQTTSATPGTFAPTYTLYVEP